MTDMFLVLIESRAGLLVLSVHNISYVILDQHSCQWTAILITLVSSLTPQLAPQMAPHYTNHHSSTMPERWQPLALRSTRETTWSATEPPWYPSIGKSPPNHSRLSG